MLQFEYGANGCLWVSQVTAGRKNYLRFEIAGSKALLEWNSEALNQLWIGHRQQSNELLRTIARQWDLLFATDFMSVVYGLLHYAGRT